MENCVEKDCEYCAIIDDDGTEYCTCYDCECSDVDECPMQALQDF